jgi:uncharacterized membrane protein
MSKEPKNYSSLNNFGKFRFTNRLSFFPVSTRICVFFLLLILGLSSNIKAQKAQQTPASKLKVVVASNAPKSSQNKAKAKTVKTKVKKAKAARKDTLVEIDPANTNSPLFEKN